MSDPIIDDPTPAGSFLSDSDDHWNPDEIARWVEEGREHLVSPLELSRALQSRLGEVRGGKGGRAAETPEELTARIRKNIEAIHVELAELLMETPWKDWKTYSDKFLDSDRIAAIKEEAIDIYFFLNNIFIALGVDDREIQHLYSLKFKKNMARQAEGGVYR